MHPDLVIFDCDGVLVDSEATSGRVALEAIAELGVVMSREEMSGRYLGASDADMLRDIERRLGVVQPPGFMERLESRKIAAFEKGVPAMTGSVQAVREVVGADLLACVATSGTTEETRAKLDSVGLRALFAGRIFSARQVPRGKPHPDLFLFAAAEMGVAPDRCVVVEDSLSGVRAAVAAGMRVLGYVPQGDGTVLREAGAEVFHDMADLPALLGL